MDTTSNNQENIITTEEIEILPEITFNQKLHTVARHLFLTLCVLLALSIVLFLIYQNGKSIYDKGI